MTTIFNMTNLEDQISKSLWNTEHHLNLISSSLAHYHHLLKILNLLLTFQIIL